VNAAVEGLVAGGAEIAGARGLAGHSDADVLCHALADALLGATPDPEFNPLGLIFME
jgi:2C-methyl-D-erythritol 2,4-cyclodiphosphate synthase